MDGEIYKKMVQDSGSKIGIESDECVLYKTEHGNCGGCEYELGCGKFVAIMLIVSMGAAYTATDFADQMKTYNEITKRVKIVIKAKTSGEVKEAIS